MRMGNKLKIFVLSVLAALISLALLFAAVKAGSLSPSGPVGATMHTLEQIYNTLAGDSVDFTGSGLDDMAAGGTFTGSAFLNYRVQIDAAGTPNTFSWSDDGGAAWDATGVAITGAAQTLNNGVIVTFGAATGHTLGNRWDFTRQAASVDGNIAQRLKYISDNLVVAGNLSWTQSGNNISNSNSGNIGIGVASPTAYLNLKAGTSAAGAAPLKFTAGTNLTISETGALEFDGNHLYFTDDDATPDRYQLAELNTKTDGRLCTYDAATGHVNCDTSSASVGHSPLTIAAIGSTPNANGMSIDGAQVLNLQPADGTFGGIITASSQIFAGAKTFNSLLAGAAGLTVTGAAVNLNASSNFTTNIGTGTTNAAVSIGGGSNTVAIDSSDWDINTLGAMTGISGIANDSTYTQTAGNFNMSGAGTFGTGTGAVSLNGDTTIAGTKTLTITGGLASLGGNLSFTGAAPAISASTAATNISLNAGTTGTVDIAGTSTGNVNLAGGSVSTGCTIDNSTGNLACAGNITGPTTGTVGYWARNNGTSALSQATANDNLSLGSGTITTTGTITSGLINSQTISATASFTGTVQAATSFLAPTIDAATGVALNIGTTTQTALTLGRAGATTAINGSGLTVGPTAWTATPTISGLTTMTSGFDSNGVSTVAGLTIDTSGNLAVSDGTLSVTASSTSGNAGAIIANSLTSGNILSLTSTSTAAIAGNTGLNIAISGTNATSAITRYGLKSAVTAAGTTSTNVAGYFSATGGTTANYGLIVENGNVGIGATAPSARLTVNETSTGSIVDFQSSSTSLFALINEDRLKLESTLAASIGTLNDTLIDDMEVITDWTASSANTPVASEITKVKINDAAMKITTGGSSATSDYVRKTISSENWSTPTRIGFWIQATQTGQIISLQFNDSVAGVSDYNITIKEPNLWQYEEWDISAITGTSRDIVTWAQFIIDSVTNTPAFYIDQLRLYTAANRNAELFVDADGYLSSFSGKGMEFTRPAPGGGVLPSMKIDSATVQISQPLDLQVEGDVGVEYNLAFLNNDTSYITSAGPLIISGGDSNSYENLTITTSGTGDVIVDIADSLLGFKVAGVQGGQVFRILPSGDLEINSIASNLNTPFGGFGRYQNLLTYSEEFDNAAWIKTTLTATANSVAAPDGQTTADTLTSTSSDGYITQAYNTTAAVTDRTFIFSVWLRATSATTSRLKIISSSDGTADGTTVVSETRPVTADWQRFYIKGTFGTVAENYVKARIIPVDGSTGAIYGWGAQLEEAQNMGVYARSSASVITPAGQGLVALGSLAGRNVSATSAAADETVTVSTPGSSFDLIKSTGTTDTSTTTTFNLTGAPSADGTIIFIFSQAIKGATAGSQQETVIVQVNGVQISTLQTTSTTGAETATETYTAVKLNGTWRIIGTPSTSGAADVAEIYSLEDLSIEAGDLVATDPENSVGIVKSSEPYQSNLLGVISNQNSALVLGPEPEHGAPVALAGRVLVKVSLENGPIAIGDYLTSSSAPGVAMAACAKASASQESNCKSGRVIGTALEEMSNVKCQMSNQCQTINNQLVGKVMTFINVGWQNFGKAAQNQSVKWIEINGWCANIDVNGEWQKIKKTAATCEETAAENSKSQTPNSNDQIMLTATPALTPESTLTPTAIPSASTAIPAPTPEPTIAPTPEPIPELSPR